MSGAVLEPRALNELFPNWKELDAPLKVPVRRGDQFLFPDTDIGAFPPAMTPPPMSNHGNYIISLGYFGKWLAAQAENLGVEIYPGFAGT